MSGSYFKSKFVPLITDAGEGEGDRGESAELWTSPSLLQYNTLNLSLLSGDQVARPLTLTGTGGPGPHALLLPWSPVARGLGLGLSHRKLFV